MTSCFCSIRPAVGRQTDKATLSQRPGANATLARHGHPRHWQCVGRCPSARGLSSPTRSFLIADNTVSYQTLPGLGSCRFIRGHQTTRSRPYGAERPCGWCCPAGGRISGSNPSNKRRASTSGFGWLLQALGPCSRILGAWHGHTQTCTCTGTALG